MQITEARLAEILKVKPHTISMILDALGTPNADRDALNSVLRGSKKFVRRGVWWYWAKTIPCGAPPPGVTASEFYNKIAVPMIREAGANGVSTDALKAAGVPMTHICYSLAKNPFVQRDKHNIWRLRSREDTLAGVALLLPDAAARSRAELTTCSECGRPKGNHNDGAKGWTVPELVHAIIEAVKPQTVAALAKRFNVSETLIVEAISRDRRLARRSTDVQYVGGEFDGGLITVPFSNDTDGEDSEGDE